MSFSNLMSGDDNDDDNDGDGSDDDDGYDDDDDDGYDDGDDAPQPDILASPLGVQSTNLTHTPTAAVGDPQHCNPLDWDTLWDLGYTTSHYTHDLFL